MMVEGRANAWHPARGRHDSPYAKGNFSFERVICDWRTRIAVLDLRLKSNMRVANVTSC